MANILKTIGGYLVAKDCVLFDYNLKECIQSLLCFCDQVVVGYVISKDNTQEILESFIFDNRFSYVLIPEEKWDNFKGKEKISYFQNVASENLKTDYQFLCQADEVVHEKSYSEIRKAVETGADAFMCNRINLWGSPYTQLDVPLERMPCSKSVVRLTKIGFKTYDDGENIEAPLVDTYFEGGIDIWHYGFVRKKEVMKSKIINMQQGVFAMEHYDPKLDLCDIFDSTLWFKESELKSIDYPHPKIMKEWIKTRP